MGVNSHLSNIPIELTKRRQWVAANIAKEPLQADGESKASVTWPGSWTTFNDARKSDLPHVGFVLTEDDPYVFVDLDVNDDAPQPAEDVPEFTEILKAFEGTYFERSTDGHGIHIVCKGTLPRGARKGNVEVYPHGRYMICTGDVLNDKKITKQQDALDKLFAELAPNDDKELNTPLNDTATNTRDQDIVAKASAAANGDKFDSLCNGDMHGYPSQSEADYALLSIIAFYTSDDAQVRRIFRHTILGKRKKAQRDGYLDRSIDRIRKSNATRPRNGAEEINGERQELSGIRFRKGNTVETQRIQWLWRPWLSKGDFHLLVGKSETGKSHCTWALAAAMTVGRYPFTEPQDVVLLADEDSTEKVVTPSLMAHGADMERVYFLDDTRGMMLLGESMEDIQVGIHGLVESGEIESLGMVIFDPVITVLSGTKSSNDPMQARQAIAPLQKFAENMRVPVLGIHHFRKDSKNLQDGILGASAWGQVARFTWRFLEIAGEWNFEDNGHTHIISARGNMIPHGTRPLLRYSIESSEADEDIALIIFDDEVGSADIDAMVDDQSTLQKPVDRAFDYLQEQLANGKEVEVATLKNECETRGISWRTMQRAKKRLAAKSVQRPDGWYWLRK